MADADPGMIRSSGKNERDCSPVLRHVLVPPSQSTGRLWMLYTATAWERPGRSICLHFRRRASALLLEMFLWATGVY